MAARFRSKPIEGEYVRYDGSNHAEIAAFAGRQYEGADSKDQPLVRSRAGDLHIIRRGWTLSKVDDTDGVTVSSPQAWEERAEEAA